MNSKILSLNLKDKDIVCEATGCYEKATKKVKVSAGKFGEISILVCKKCIHKFK